MTLTYASQRDYDAMADKPGDGSSWSAQDFAAIGAKLGQAPAPESVAARGHADMRPTADSQNDLLEP